LEVFKLAGPDDDVRLKILGFVPDGLVTVIRGTPALV
jgi:hypothetical protein